MKGKLYTKLKRSCSHKSHYTEKFKHLKSTIQKQIRNAYWSYLESVFSVTHGPGHKKKIYNFTIDVNNNFLQCINLQKYRTTQCLKTKFLIKVSLLYNLRLQGTSLLYVYIKGTPDIRNYFSWSRGVRYKQSLL